MTDMPHRYRKMEERIEYLEDAYMRLLDNIGILTSSRAFVDDMTEIRDPASIVASAGLSMKHLLPFKEIAFLLTKETDSSFCISYCDPASDREDIEHEIDIKIGNGTFAWALRQNRPLIVPSVREGLTVILHVLSTQSRTRGMFIGIIETSALNITDPLFSLLTAIAQNISYAIESAILYAMLQGKALTLEQEVERRTVLLQQELDKRKKAEEALLKAHDELEEKVSRRTTELSDANTALKFLLKQREEDKKELEDRIISNVKKIILPSIEQLKKGKADQRYESYLNLLESNLIEIIAPFSMRLSSQYQNLTQAEIGVINFIKEGKSSKKIAEILNISKAAIDFHRNNIRSKLGLKNTKTNLRTYLLSIK